MTAGPLIDLDPELPAHEARWPFYVAWAFGGAVLGAVMLAHLPASTAHPAVIVPEAVPTSEALPTAAPAVDIRRPGATPLRAVPSPPSR